MKSFFLSELKTDRYGKTKGFDLDFENARTFHVKDGYDDIWTDFLDEDLSKALKHAKQELELAISDKTNKKMHLKKTCRDLKNYFIAASGLVREDFSTSHHINPVDESDKYSMWDRDAIKLISALASFEDRDVDEWVTDVIWSRFRPDDEHDPIESFPPNYRELYQEIGDIALFYRGDDERAMLWYALLPIDWEDIEEVDEELENDGIQIKKQNHWWDIFNQNVEKLIELTHDDMHNANMSFANTLDISNKSEEKLQAYLSQWRSYQEGIDDVSAQQIWSCANDYCDVVKSDMENANDYLEERTKRKLRTEVIFARIIIDQAKYYRLVAMANKKDELTDVEISEARDILMQGNLYTDKAQHVEIYLRNKARLEECLSYDTVNKSLILIKAISACDKILSALNKDILSERVAYYTSLKTLKKMLPGTVDAPDNIGKFAVMHVAYMNDPNEGKILEQWIFDRQTDRNSYGRQKADYPYVFIKCFTTRIDDLPMWEMYGDDAKGCCIVIDMGRIMKSDLKAYPVYNVCYLKKNKEGSFEIELQDNLEINAEGINIIKEKILELCNIRREGGDDIHYQVALQDVLSRVTYLFKNADYSYEREKRIVYSISSGLSKRIRQTIPESDSKSPLLYVLSDMNVHIDEIILGPKSSNASWELPYLQKSLDEMRKEIGNDETIPISYSNISYR